MTEIQFLTSLFIIISLVFVAAGMFFIGRAYDRGVSDTKWHHRIMEEIRLRKHEPGEIIRSPDYMAPKVKAIAESAPGMMILGLTWDQILEIKHALETYVIRPENLRDELRWNYENRPRPYPKKRKKK